MYKLTYDSEDEENDEVNTKGEKQEQPSDNPDPALTPATTPQNGQMKDAGKKKEKFLNGKGRTKDNARYEGNGSRFYSLFANDNFMTEDPKAKNKKCGFGLKMVLLVLTIMIMIAGILCLIMVMSSLRDQQHLMLQRIANLEDAVVPNALAAFSSPQTDANSVDVEQAPPEPSLEDIMTAFNAPTPNEADCCMTNQEQMSVLRAAISKQANKLDTLETKTQRHIQSAEVHFAEVLQKAGANSAEVKAARTKISSVQSSAEKARSLAYSAKNLALLALEDLDVDEDQLSTYMENIGSAEPEEVVAFGVAHAISYATDGSPQADEAQNSGVLYDVRSGFSPAISFKKTTIGSNEHIVPEGGVFHVPSDGTYIIFANLCVQDRQMTIVHLMRNGQPIREMEMSSPSESFAPISTPQSNDNFAFQAPPVIRPPLPPDDWSHDSVSADSPPSMDEEMGRIQPYQFTDLIKLAAGDSLYLKLLNGKLVEYKDLGTGESGFTHACNRFAGYRLR